MKPGHGIVSIAAALLVLGACGRMEGDTFERVSAELRAEVARHRAAGDGPMDRGTCAAELDRYGGAVRDQVGRMTELSGRMDRCMAGRDGGTMREYCDQLSGELGRHLDGGCSDDADQNRAELGTHCDRMLELGAGADGAHRRMDGGCPMMGAGERCH